jgi:hypothetical protein
MTQKSTRTDRQVWKQGQLTLLGNPEFIVSHILPLLRDASDDREHADWAFEVIRNKLSSRMTLRYKFGPTFEVYGKAYHEAPLASETHRIMADLWKHGFSASSNMNIPEPIGVISAANLLLMRRAEGIPLSDLVSTGRIDDALAGARLAARWLVKFQSTTFSGLRSESPVEKVEVLKLADAVAKVVAELPEHSTLLIEMLHNLRSIAPGSNSSPAPVLMHGQYRPGHVFVQNNQATIIDIEKVCLSDPAKDVARFCHVLEKTCIEQAGDTARAERVAREFIEEYRKLNQKGLENFHYFKALLAMKALAKMLKNRKVEEHQRQMICQMYNANFQRALQEGVTRTIAA